MTSKFTIAVLLLNFISVGLFAQIPFVYNKENTGMGCTKPPLPPLSQLPVIEPLPDPFVFNTPGKGRSTSFSDWECRRNEIKAQIENYEIGRKPDRPEDITATYTPNANPATGVLRVVVTVNGQSLTLTSNVSLPTGSGPFPAVIGMNSPSGSIPGDIFTSRNIARITFSHNNVTTYLNPQITDPYYRLYPDQNLDNAGQYSAWAWGVSRLIDGLELVQSSLPIDLRHIAVTGCSYAGKMALYAGAFDERIALTIAQESGGGGAPSWRVSHNIEPNGSVEKIDNTDYNWFKNDMRQFSADNVYKLPEDHHELMAMVAPRALLVTGNTDFVWLSNKSCYVSARAAKEVYKTLGISDRMGFYIDGGHNHCAVPTSQRPAISAFVDRFLLDKTDVITDTVTVNPFPGLDYQRWYKWWGTGNPVLPPPPPEPFGIRIWMEAECAAVGSSWQTLTDADASNGKYVVVNGLNSTATAPAGANAAIAFTFTVDSAAPYNLYARLNCPTANDDSYWIKVDNGAFVTYNNLTTTGWQWIRLITGANLSVGQHTVTIAYREDGAKLDKILLTTTLPNLTAKGTEGSNCGAPPTIVPNQVFSVSEHAFNDSTFGRVQATDPDANSEFQNWRIVDGTGASAFRIDAETGALFVKDSSAFDFESATRSYTLTLTTTDGYFKSAPETITINLSNENDNTPVVTSGMSFALDGGTCSQLGEVLATDADDTNQPGFTSFQNWQIVGGTGAGIFAINPSNGMITIADLQHADLNNSNYTLVVTVSDSLHTSAPQTVTITIPNKITICHKGKLISVSKMAAVAHIQHGDCIGSCGQPAGTTRLSSEAILKAEGIRVYPNPVTDQLNIDLGTNSLHIRSVELVDITGRTVLKMQVKNSLIKVPKGSLTTGAYILQLKGDKLLSKQITIQ